MRPIVDIKVVGTDCSNGMKLLKNLSKVEREIDLTFCSKKSLTSKVGDELRLLMLEEY